MILRYTQLLFLHSFRIKCYSHKFFHCYNVPLTAYFDLFADKPNDIFDALVHSIRTCFRVLSRAQFVQKWAQCTLWIQFRNCVDLWTTCVCQRPLEIVQETIKVIGRGPRLKIVFRSHASTSSVSSATTFFVTQIGPAGAPSRCPKGWRIKWYITVTMKYPYRVHK